MVDGWGGEGVMLSLSGLLTPEREPGADYLMWEWESTGTGLST